MSIPQELEDYINYQFGIIDSLNHSLAHVSNDLTVNQRILITSYYKLLSRVNHNTPTLKLFRDQEPCKCTGFDRAIRMKPCSVLNNTIYYTSYGNVIYINPDLSITVLGVPMVDEIYGLKTIIPRHLRELYNISSIDLEDKGTIDITMECFADAFITAGIEIPESYEIRTSFAEIIYDNDYNNIDRYNLGYDAGIDFVESIM